MKVIQLIDQKTARVVETIVAKNFDEVESYISNVIRLDYFSTGSEFDKDGAYQTYTFKNKRTDAVSLVKVFDVLGDVDQLLAYQERGE